MRRKGFVLSDENEMDNKRKVNKIKWTIQQVEICDENIKSRENRSLEEFKECVKWSGKKLHIVHYRKRFFRHNFQRFPE